MPVLRVGQHPHRSPHRHPRRHLLPTSHQTSRPYVMADVVHETRDWRRRGRGIRSEEWEGIGRGGGSGMGDRGWGIEGLGGGMEEWARGWGREGGPAMHWRLVSCQVVEMPPIYAGDPIQHSADDWVRGDGASVHPVSCLCFAHADRLMYDLTYRWAVRLHSG